MGSTSAKNSTTITATCAAVKWWLIRPEPFGSPRVRAAMISPWWMPSIRGSAAQAMRWSFACRTTFQTWSFRRISAANLMMRRLPFSFLRRKLSRTSRAAPKATTCPPPRGRINRIWPGMWTGTCFPLITKACRFCLRRRISERTTTTNRISFSWTPTIARTYVDRRWAATWPL